MRPHSKVQVAAVGDDLAFQAVAADEYLCLPAAASLRAIGPHGKTVERC